MMRVLNFEIVRAKTLKSTWIFPAIGIALALGVTLIITNEIDSSTGRAPTIADVINNAYSPLSIFFITIVFAQSFGHDYRDGTMRLTLSAFPNRIQVFIAKLLVPAVISILSTVITCVGIALIVFSNDKVINSGLLTAVFRQSAFTLMWGFIVASIVVFTRNLAAGIAGLVVWTIILEALVGSILATKFPKLPDYLPMSQGLTWSQQGGREHLVVILVATALLTGLALLKFTKKDA